MPRFREADKAVIRKTLVTEGKKLFQRYGIKKTNVDELARSVGIAKGTFYHFFESKEDLCLAIFDREEELMAAHLRSILARYPDPFRTFKAVIDFSLAFVRGDSLLVRLRELGEYELLARGVSPSKLAEHLRHDEGTAVMLINAMKAKGVRLRIKPDVLAGVLRAFVALSTQDKIIGEHVFPPVMDLLTSWISTGLVRGKDKV